MPDERLSLNNLTKPYFVQWRDDGTWAKVVTALRERTRVAAGCEPTPSVVCIDRQSVKTTEMGGPERGYDGGKNIKGRKRHLLVDTLGWWLAVLITSARLDDGVAAPLLLSHVTPQDLPRLVTIFADQKYHNHALDAWMATHRTGWRIEVKARPEAIQGFTPLAKLWVIERTNAWHGRYRRNSQDYERSVASSTAMIQISHVHLMLHRLAPCDRPAFHYRKDAACDRHDVAEGFPDSLSEPGSCLACASCPGIMLDMGGRPSLPCRLSMSALWLPAMPAYTPL